MKTGKKVKELQKAYDAAIRVVGNLEKAGCVAMANDMKKVVSDIAKELFNARGY